MMMMIAVHRVGLAIDTIFNTMPGWLLRSTVSPHVTRVQRQLRHRHGTTSPVIPWHWGQASQLVRGSLWTYAYRLGPSL